MNWRRSSGKWASRSLFPIIDPPGTGLRPFRRHVTLSIIESNQGVFLPRKKDAFLHSGSRLHKIPFPQTAGFVFLTKYVKILLPCLDSRIGGG